jgi:hypothetical protein
VVRGTTRKGNARCPARGALAIAGAADYRLAACLRERFGRQSHNLRPACWMTPGGKATGRVCGLRLFVDEGYSMARDDRWHGRDADPARRDGLRYRLPSTLEAPNAENPAGDCTRGRLNV